MHYIIVYYTMELWNYFVCASNWILVVFKYGYLNFIINNGSQILTHDEEKLMDITLVLVMVKKISSVNMLKK